VLGGGRKDKMTTCTSVAVAAAATAADNDVNDDDGSELTLTGFLSSSLCR